MPARKKTKDDTLPATFRQFTEMFPEIAAAHEAIARSVDGLGPLDRKTCELIKLGMSIGAGLITATQSHTRRARKEGASLERLSRPYF
jgi:alkylhydroperoxidase/carboxymuconolactone decarboxylase family protein YurZ